MSKYRIPCQWTMVGTLIIEAENEAEAIVRANSDKEGLPEDGGDFLAGSFSVFEDEVTEEEPDLWAEGAE